MGCSGGIGNIRHWFSLYGVPGLRAPVCVRCGEPNPRPLKPDEWDDLISYRGLRGRPFGASLEAAIAAHQEQS